MVKHRVVKMIVLQMSEADPLNKKPLSHGTHLWMRDVHMVKCSMNTSQTGAGKVSWQPCNITHCISCLSTIFIHLTYLIIRASDQFVWG